MGEQAIKGYSQRYQRRPSGKYCLSNTLDVQDVIYEDYSISPKHLIHPPEN